MLVRCGGYSFPCRSHGGYYFLFPLILPRRCSISVERLFESIDLLRGKVALGSGRWTLSYSKHAHGQAISTYGRVFGPSFRCPILENQWFPSGAFFSFSFFFFFLFNFFFLFGEPVAAETDSLTHLTSFSGHGCRLQTQATLISFCPANSSHHWRGGGKVSERIEEEMAIAYFESIGRKSKFHRPLLSLAGIAAAVLWSLRIPGGMYAAHRCTHSPFL